MYSAAANPCLCVSCGAESCSEWQVRHSCALILPQEEIDTINSTRQASLPSPQLARVMAMANSSTQIATATSSAETAAVGEHSAGQSNSATANDPLGSAPGLLNDSHLEVENHGEQKNHGAQKDGGVEGSGGSEAEPCVVSARSHVLVDADAEGGEGVVGGRVPAASSSVPTASSSAPAAVPQRQAGQLNGASPRTRGSYIPLAVARAAGVRQAEYLQQLQV